MVIVAAINMITALLVLILERTQLIGTLKALGSTNWSIRKIFLFQSFYLIGRGLFWVILVGIGLALIQFYLAPIQLDPQTYYMSVVPVHLKISHLILLNFEHLLFADSNLFYLHISSVKSHLLKPFDSNNRTVDFS